jgi:hypothetical protein
MKNQIASALAVIAIVGVAAGVLAGRDKSRRIDHLERDLGELRAAHNTNTKIERAAFDELQAQAAVCEQRTESIHGVLEILIPSGIWPDRVVLPDPPPGWRPWPAGNKYGHEPN